MDEMEQVAVTEVTSSALIEIALILGAVVVVARHIRREIGFDTHGSRRQWAAAFLVGLGLAVRQIAHSPERYLTADVMVSPYPTPTAATVAGALTALALMAGLVVTFSFDRYLGRYWLYRLARIVGRGFVLMFVILLAVKSWVDLSAMTVVW